MQPELRKNNAISNQETKDVDAELEQLLATQKATIKAASADL